MQGSNQYERLTSMDHVMLYSENRRLDKVRKDFAVRVERNGRSRDIDDLLRLKNNSGIRENNR